MRERLLQVLGRVYYKAKNDDCICEDCVFYDSKIDLSVEPDRELLERAKLKVYSMRDILVECCDEKLIDAEIDPFLVSIVIFEDLMERKDFTLNELQKNGLILGYIHSFVQYLWSAQNIRNRRSDILEDRVNRIMFNRGDVVDVQLVEIGITQNRSRDGYVVYIPKLLENSGVDMEYNYMEF